MLILTDGAIENAEEMLRSPKQGNTRPPRQSQMAQLLLVRRRALFHRMAGGDVRRVVSVEAVKMALP